jgi:threonine dehydratase
MQFDVLKKSLRDGEFGFTEVTSETDVAFRLIHYESKLLRTPYFITLEFHERSGALADFLRAVSPHANLCYFNYVYSGERVGRALIGFEFDTPEQHDEFTDVLESAKDAYRAYERVSEATMQRILG